MGRRPKKTALRIQSCHPRERGKWDFGKVPASQQEHCYLYEYCLEIPEIVEEVEDYRARQTNRAELEEKARTREAMHKMRDALRPATDANSAAESFLRFYRDNPELMEARRTRLDDCVAFLLDWEEFPRKHWQQIPAAKRTEEAQHHIFYYDLHRRSRGAKMKLEIVPPQELWDLLAERQPKKPGEQWDLTDRNRWEETIAVRLDWNRSSTELAKDFKELLEKQLREGRQPFQKSKDVRSRQTDRKRTRLN